MNKEKKIPTIIGLILLVISIFAGVYFGGGQKLLKSKASGDCTPGTIQITNITPDSLDISFQTPSVCLSNLSIDNRTISDIRFINTSREPFASKLHYFQINNLTENTNYQFSIINNGVTYNKNNYNTLTAKRPKTTIPLSNLAWGRIYNPDSTPATNTIIYLNIPGAAPLSSFVTPNGYWNISLASSLNDAKNDWFLPPKSSVDEEIIVISENSQPTQITSNTTRNNPVPDIIIGKNSFSSAPTVNNTSSNALNSVSPVISSQKLSISNPKENETLSVQRPDFFGTGPVNSKISIKLESPLINDETTSLNNGSWHWSPTQNLSLGEHTITVSAQGETTIIRKFFISAQNNPLAFSASSSANLITPTSVPTTIPTPTNPTPTNPITPTSTPTSVITPTSTPTPIIRASKPSTSSGVPATGVTAPTLITLFLAGISFLSFYVFRKK